MNQPPANDRQFDLFVPFIADMPLRDQRETMERPFFSLSKNKRLKPIEYTSPDKQVYVNVFPNQEFGMATIWDADILIWAASTLCELKKKRANDLPRTLHFQPYDLLKTLRRETGGRQYMLLRESLSRLQATTIRTNIRADKARRKERQFGWIESFTDVIDERTKTSKGMSITLSDWFYEGVVMDGGVLAIDPAYFAIKGGRERWLYRVARKHAGGAGEDGFAIALLTLFEKSGAEGTYRRFKFEIAKIVRADGLPGFALRLDAKEQGEPTLVIKRREFVTTEPHGPPSIPSQRGQRSSKQTAEAPILPFSRHPSDATFTRIRTDFPGWDIQALKAEFDAWIDDKPARMPKNYNAALYGFVRKHAARNRP
jgi:plasmid replication initiation protein